VCANGLQTLGADNSCPTFVNNGGRSIIDVTFAGHQVANARWKLSELDFLSCHKGIEIELWREEMGAAATEVPSLNGGGGVWKIDPVQYVQRLPARLRPLTSAPLTSVEEIDCFVAKLSDTIIYCAERAQLVDRRGSRNRSKPWWTKELDALRRKTNRLNRKRRRYPRDPVLLSEFRICRRKYKDLIERAKEESFERFCNATAAPWNGLWKLLKRDGVRRTSGLAEGAEPGLTAEETPFADFDACAEHLATKFFPDVVDVGNCDTPCRVGQDPMHDASLNIARQWRVSEQVLLARRERDADEPAAGYVGPRYGEVNRAELNLAFKSMGAHKAPGHDRIIPWMVKRGLENLSSHLLRLYNACFALQYFPSAWKQARVITVPKPHASPNMEFHKRLRPISLLPVLGKGLESIIHGRLRYLATKHSWFSSRQFGFLEGKNCEMALARLVAEIHEQFQQKRGFLAIFLDIEGAYDRAWHDAILCRLVKRGCPDYLVLLVRSYLSGRIDL